MMTLDLRAYVDDSETEGSFSVLASYIGRADDWATFEKDWRVALQRDGLREFKTQHCEMGNGQFTGFTRGYRR
jgi:hypothetical protein